MKPKANTLQERFGFKDDELSTAKHDEIMFWLNDNINAIVADLFPREWAESEIKTHGKLVEDVRRSWLETVTHNDNLGEDDAKKLRILKAEVQHWRQRGDRDKAHEHQSRLDEFISSITPRTSAFPHPGDVPIRPLRRIEGVSWEFPITEAKFVIGFADLRVATGKPRLFLEGTEGSTIKPRWALDFTRENLFFEVKPTIRSLGELLRQINFYRTYEKSPFYVVSPDDRFRPTLKTQDVGFVKYPTQ